MPGWCEAEHYAREKSMGVTVRFFAVLREQVGKSQIELELEQPCSVRDVWAELECRYPQLTRYASCVRFAVNQEYAALDGTVRPGDEVALIPPVSGG